MTTYRDSERIRRRMSRLRGRIDGGVSQWRQDAGRWFSWETYVREYPLVVLAATAAFAFWLMPGRRVPQRVQLDAASIQELVRQGGVRIEAVQARRPTLMSSAVSFASSLLFRGLLAYVGQQLGRTAGAEAGEAVDAMDPVER